MEYFGTKPNTDRRPKTDKELIWRRTPNIARLGHLTVGENNRNQPLSSEAVKKMIEATLDPNQKSSGKVEFSSWHRIEHDDDGKVKALSEQHYGKEMQAQVNIEQGLTGVPPVSPQKLGAIASQISDQGLTGHVAVPPRSSDNDDMTPLPMVPIQQQQSAATQPQPVAPTNTSSLPINTKSAPTVSLTGALNPNVVDSAGSVFNETITPEALPTGPLIKDPSHLLPAKHTTRFVTIFTSPWFWLIVGLGLIVWFV